MENTERLQNLIDEAEGLLKEQVTYRSDKFKIWKDKAIRVLTDIFGEDSIELRQFKNIGFAIVKFTGVSQTESIQKCASGLKRAIANIQEYMVEMNERNRHGRDIASSGSEDFSRVFIVHGHDEALKHEVARLIEKQGIDAIILSEQRNGGNTIIEKFEKNSDVGAAVFLFTADDLGKAKDKTDLKQRARQNVVFEAGYFMGKLGRDRTIMIAEKDIEIPSDMHGIVYTDSENWQFDVLRELEGIGYNIDYKKQFGIRRG